MGLDAQADIAMHHDLNSVTLGSLLFKNLNRNQASWQSGDRWR